MHIKRLAPLAIVAVAALTSVAGRPANADTVIVSPANPNSWAAVSQRTATGQFVFGPAIPPSGTGSYEMTTGAGNAGPNLPQGGAGNGGKTWLSTNFYDGNTPLASITALGYSTYVSPASAPTVQLTPALQLQIDINNDGLRDTTMVFEPIYSVATQGPVVKGAWQTWDARNGIWWLTKAIPGFIAFDGYYTYDAIVTAYSSAQIVTWFNLPDGYGVQFVTGQNSAGAPWQGFIGNVDKFTITKGGTSRTYDFEVDRDGDGVPDVDDQNPDSDGRPFVDVNGNEPGQTTIPNVVNGNGVSIQDPVNAYAAGAKNHGQYVSAIGKLADDLYAAGVITKAQRQEMKTGAAQSDVGK